MSKKCENCGRFMKLTDLMPDTEKFDEETAHACGYDERYSDDMFDEKWERFHYIQDTWECDHCQCYEWHTEGPRYYWNPDSCNYDGKRPETDKEREQRLAREKRERLEAAGQMRMF